MVSVILHALLLLLNDVESVDDPIQEQVFPKHHKASIETAILLSSPSPDHLGTISPAMYFIPPSFQTESCTDRCAFLDDIHPVQIEDFRCPISSTHSYSQVALQPLVPQA